MSESENEEPRSKKRQLNKDEHVFNKEKLARRRGEEFVSSTGLLVSAKVTGPNCECRNKCMNSFSDDDKKNIIKTLYDGKPKNEFDTFLIGLIERHEVARHRPSTEHSKQIDSSFTYYAMKGSVRTKVCRKAYISLHALSHKAVIRLTHILCSNKSPFDKRGKHDNRGNAIPLETNIKIREHIESFPKHIAHYTSTPVTYLAADLNVKKMHELFIAIHPNLKQLVKYEYYLNYYKTNYNFRFGRPQVDVCSTCEDLITKMKSTTLNDNAKRVASAEFIVHKRRAKKFYTKLQEIKELSKIRPEVQGIAFDFMQNLPIPFLPVQEMFYLRKLWFYVFNIYDFKNDKAYFYVYPEGNASRGPNEVCSMVLDFVTNNIPAEVQELHVFSDACGGQNRNHPLCRLFSALTMKNKFKVINHYYPVRGHSFMPCDRTFGTVKREVRRHDRVYSPEQYISLIGSSKKTHPKFEIKSVECDTILNFKGWWSNHFVKMPRSIEDRKTYFKISTYRQFTFKNDPPGYVETSTFIDSAVKSTFKLKKNNCVELPNTKAYPEGRVPIKKEKLNDLKKIIHYIPEEHRAFYEERLQWPTTSAQEDDYD